MTNAERSIIEIVILLGAGLRVSEMYGLIKSDIDFESRKIRIERQLTRDKHCEYYIEHTLYPHEQHGLSSADGYARKP